MNQNTYYRFADNNRILWSGRTHITDVVSEVQATGVWKAAQLTEDDLINADYTLGVIVCHSFFIPCFSIYLFTYLFPFKA